MGELAGNGCAPPENGRRRRPRSHAQRRLREAQRPRLAVALAADRVLAGVGEQRADMTDQERRLWYGWLRKMPFLFQRQKPIGGYIADFYCHRAKLVVEVDGWRHFTEEGHDSDDRRTAFLESQGLLVLRYRGHAVDSDIAAVAAQIEQVARERIAALAR